MSVQILTDSKSFFDIVSIGSRSSENRIILDINVLQQAYKTLEIDNIDFARSSLNLFDGLTNPKVQAELYQLLAAAYYKPKTEQWIIKYLQ